MTGHSYYRDVQFEASASPEVVAVHLDAERRAAAASAAAFARRIAWLAELLDRRTAEKTAGTWPATPAGTDTP